MTEQHHGERAEDQEEHLATYLNEHLLASEGGLRAFHAAAKTWAGTPHERELLKLADQIDRDRRDLARIIHRLGHRPAAWKRLLTLSFRAVGSVNPVNFFRQRDSSMAQLELDMLTGAVRAKLSMWDALLDMDAEDDRFDRDLLADLKARAEHQIADLQRISLTTWHERFGRAGA